MFIYTGGGVGLARFRKVRGYLCEFECIRSLTVVKRYCGGWRYGGVQSGRFCTLCGLEYDNAKHGKR